MSQKKETYVKYRNEKGRYTKKSHKVEPKKKVEPFVVLMSQAVVILINKTERMTKHLKRIRLAIWVIVLYLVFLTLMQPEVLMWIGENL